MIKIGLSVYYRLAQALIEINLETIAGIVQKSYIRKCFFNKKYGCGLAFEKKESIVE